MRNILVKNEFAHKKGTQWRGHEVQRIEAFTDAVFAFAVTLLAVSLEVPKSFDELLETMKGFLGFAFTFAILFVFWYRQYIFFRKYGIDDKTIIAYNGVLLCAVLFFIYPFKFMSYLIVSMVFYRSDERLHEIINVDRMPELLSLYYFGIGLMNGTLGLMYRHALRYRQHLLLNDEEEKEAVKQYITGMLSIVLFGLMILLLFVLPVYLTSFSIFPIFLLPISTRLMKRKSFNAAKYLPPAVPPVQEA